MKNARIKGTDFELDDPQTDYEPGGVQFMFEGSSFYWVPKAWVEFYDPPREEPPIGSVEQGVSGNVYVRRDQPGYNYNWSSLNAEGNAFWIAWWKMQQDDGPTKQMIVKE